MRLGWKLPLERLSATSLSMAIECPELFRRKYLLKQEERLFGKRFVGIVDHAMAEDLTRDKLTALAPDPMPIDQLYRQVWNRTLEREGEPDWRDDDPVSMFNRGVKMAELYAQEVIPEIDPVFVEERVEVTIPGIPSKIIGYCDVIERTKVRERKTTGMKTTKPKPKWRFQGKIYQLATGLPVQWDVITSQVTPKLYTAREHEDLYMEYRNPDSTVRMIRDAALRINDLYATHGADQPWPTTGIFSQFLCSYCPAGPRYGGDCIEWIQN